MAIRTTVDIPEALHATLRHKAAQSGTSMRSLILQAIEERYSKKKSGAYVTEPPIKRKPGGKVGPLMPTDENPHDLVFS
jgi:UTP:GlnB (protein PII) uridylyltransferase